LSPQYKEYSPGSSPPKASDVDLVKHRAQPSVKQADTYRRKINVKDF
jgi:hypothetical protein